jgi:hypothetical protein
VVSTNVEKRHSLGIASLWVGTWYLLSSNLRCLSTTLILLVVDGIESGHD